MNKNTDEKNMIACSANASKFMKKIISEEDYFVEEMDLAKFAAFYASNYGLKNVKVENKKTKWSTGSVNKNNEITNVLKIIYPDETKLMNKFEDLMESGLRFFEDQIKEDRNWLKKEIENIADL